MAMAPDEFMDARRREEIDREAEAVALVRMGLRVIVGEAGPWIWQWGDGEGGWFMEQLVAAAIELGFPVPTTSLSLPKTGASRYQVFERDAYRCQQCGGWHDLTIDHVIPRARGGTNDLANLQTLCRSCNSKKGAR